MISYFITMAVAIAYRRLSYDKDHRQFVDYLGVIGAVSILFTIPAGILKAPGYVICIAGVVGALSLIIAFFILRYRMRPRFRRD